MKGSEIFVGRTYSGHLLTITIELTPLSHPMTTIEHEPVQGGMRLSISGDLWDPRNMRQPLVGGAVWSAVPLVQPREQWDAEDLQRLHDIWKRWHLNDLCAGCAHMQLPEDRSYEARWFIVCEQQLQAGEFPPYKYGSGWLYAPLTDDVVEDVLRFQGRAGRPGYRLGDGLRS